VPLEGHSTLRLELTKAAENVQFGRQTSAASAAAFLAASQAAISK